MSKYEQNGFNTTHLVLNVMATVARSVGLDINDDDTANRLYDICCDLESFPEDEGFGSSDHYSYIQQAKAEFEPDDGGYDEGMGQGGDGYTDMMYGDSPDF